MIEKPVWLDLPLDQFPAAEADELLDSWRQRLLQIEYGAHRQSCEWNYTLFEQSDHVIDVLLPDAQMMRYLTRILGVKARLEITKKHHGEAARTIETGLAFSQHVANGPFLINALIGVASAQVMLARVEELVSLPDAPNLYWSLTALPRPLISMRKAITNEYKMCEWMLPEMTDLGRDRTSGEWAALVARLHGRMVKLMANYRIGEIDPKGRELPGFREWVLPEAREYAKSRMGKIEGLNDDQMILMYFGGKYRDLYDDVYKACYLPFPEAKRFYAQGQQQLLGVKQGPLRLFDALIANVDAGHRAEAILDRKVAALRVVEGLRLHAAIAGRLPQSLDEVKVVPIPNDPVSGQPFEYRFADGTATLVSRMPDGQESLGLTYRITLRK